MGRLTTEMTTKRPRSSKTSRILMCVQARLAAEWLGHVGKVTPFILGQDVRVRAFIDDDPWDESNLSLIKHSLFQFVACIIRSRACRCAS